MYLKHGECKNRGGIVTVIGIAVISPPICCLLKTQEGENNAIYVL